MDLNVILIVLFILLIVFLVIYFKYRKKLKVDSICLITGGVKTGKSCLGVHLAIKEYKLQYRKWFLKHLFNKSYEKPLLYSNIPLYINPSIWHFLARDVMRKDKKFCVPYAPIINDLLDRKKRLNYGSICYLGEFSLVADSQSGVLTGSAEDREFTKNLAERLCLFVKLFGHETGGQCVVNGKKIKSIGPGKCICDTQALADVHFGLRRNVTSAIFIERSIKWIPFILLFKVRELIYLDENSVNVFDKDVEDANLKWYICKKPYKHFDYCCYSVFTDKLETSNDLQCVSAFDSKKVTYLPSFRKFRSIDIDEKGFINNGKNE